MNSMEARRAELEKKRQKLEQLRNERLKAKEEKERQQRLQAAAAGTGEASIAARSDVDDILDSLGISLLSGKDSPLGSSGVAGSGHSVGVGGDTPDVHSIASSVQATPTRKARKNVALQVVTVNQSNIPPKECVMYSKTTQTLPGNDREGGYGGKGRKATQPVDYYVLTHWDEEWDDEFQEDVLTYGDEENEEGGAPPSLEAMHQKAQQMAAQHAQQGHHPVGHHAGAPPGHGNARGVEELDELIKKKEEEIRKAIRLLNEEERQQIYLSPEFRTFMDRSSRIMERALTEDVDIFTDYAGAAEETEAEDKSRMKLSKSRMFFAEQWCRNKLVTSFDWSSQFPELFAASYTPIDDREAEGLVMIWNMKYKKDTPEYIFRSQSGVMSTCFAKFHPNLVIGGLYSGQIVVWDNRSHKKTPVQRSPLSAQSHTHPVYSIQVVGTQNAHNLVSISTDGKFCSWSLDMLSQPQDTLDLNHAKQSKPAAVTCMSFPHGEFNHYVIGSEEGTVYSACRHGSKLGIIDSFDGHHGPVTGIQHNNTVGPVDFSYLFLTSSFDWTVKLWSLKESKPIHSFENNSDYIYDVGWSPYNPAVFATVDGTGRLDLWNLNSDAELPTVSEVIEAPSPKDEPPALNRLIWSQTGHQIVAGDDDGRCHVYEVGDQLAMPKHDEWNKLLRMIQELKSNNQVDEDLSVKNLA
ncbi:cytoplasmic dynein 1 intermediate chain 2-like isoform X2 [Varroa destructor]|uniref:Cytoplasmic dynein intermediate chain n=1 Tax=Varroa destructor TaxID=109461 RepID=A0A7M7K1M0_VARDE|nr:cytoplasmic dynein 1 intermediate chain 2-like isoform X2 [Varroa destructor]